MEILLDKHPKKEKIMERIKSLQLSRQTVTGRAEDISRLIQIEIRKKLKNAIAFSICCDESTDINEVAQLVVFARIVDSSFSVSDEILDVLPMHNTTKSADIYENILKSLKSYGKGPQDLSSFTTDGAPSMRGVKDGVVAKIKRDNPHLIDLHCIIHQEDLVAKKSIPEAKIYADKVMTIINKCISAGALRCRQFEAFLNENNSEIRKLSKMQQVRWLSVNKTFKQFLPIIHLVDQFLQSQKTKIVFEELTDQEWIQNLAFFTDLTSQFATLNKKLQGILNINS